MFNRRKFLPAFAGGVAVTSRGQSASSLITPVLWAEADVSSELVGSVKMARKSDCEAGDRLEEP